MYNIILNFEAYSIVKTCESPNQLKNCMYPPMCSGTITSASPEYSTFQDRPTWHASSGPAAKRACTSYSVPDPMCVPNGTSVDIPTGFRTKREWYGAATTRSSSTPANATSTASARNCPHLR